MINDGELSSFIIRPSSKKAGSNKLLAAQSTPKATMFQKTLDRLSENPQAWNILRRVVENGFRGEKDVIARELAPWRDAGQREFLDFGCGTGEFAPCFPP